MKPVFYFAVIFIISWQNVLADANWQNITMPQHSNGLGITFVNNDTGFMVTDTAIANNNPSSSSLYYTTNGGSDWTYIAYLPITRIQ